jgi:hypothetical protein
LEEFAMDVVIFDEGDDLTAIAFGFVDTDSGEQPEPSAGRAAPFKDDDFVFDADSGLAG